MFWMKHKRGEAKQRSPAPEPAPVVAPPSQHTALLHRWMSLASMQQRVIEILAAEITRTSEFVETEADHLSEQFQRLAVNAQQQTARVESLTELAMGIEVEGKTIRIDEVAKMFEGTLGEVVSKILLLSKDSMAMVYALDTLGDSVRNVGKCNANIDLINGTLNMLALNARIEGERAGVAGAAFRVVANEVYELSKTTKTLAGTMKSEIAIMTGGITSSHDTLKRVATVDMSTNMLVKEQLEGLLEALVERNQGLEILVAEAAKQSGAISADIDGMVTGIQFQDRTKQRLEHVVDTLRVIGQALAELRSNTSIEVPGTEDISDSDMEWVKQLLSGYTMSEMRERFVSQILDGKPADWGDDTTAKGGPSESGSMELF